MDAKSSAPVKLLALLATLSIAVIAFGLVWPAWDMFGAARRPMLQGWDDSFYYFWLPSVVIDHDVDFTNQLQHSGTVAPATRDLALTLPRTPTGKLDAKYPPGWALGSLPFFLVAHAISPAGTTGFEPQYLVAVWLGQLGYALAGLWLATKIIARYFPWNIALIAGLVGWLTSPLIYYQSARLSMSHNQVFALAMAVFWLTLRLRDGDARARHWLALGFCAALMVVTRNVAFVYLTLTGWVVARHVRSIRPVSWMMLGAAVPVAIQLIAWKQIYGSWIAYSYGGERFNFHELHVADVLFSARHGWFYWHPLMLAGIAAFFVWAWSRSEGWAWLISLATIVLLSAAWPTWWLGSSFGYRGFEVPTLFGMIGLAVVLQWMQSRPLIGRAIACLLAVAIIWNIALFALFLTQRIPREEPVTYRHAASALSEWLANP